MTETEKQTRNLRHEMNLYLAVAKVNKGLSIASYYAALAAAGAGTYHTINTGRGANFLIGLLMASGMLIAAKSFRSCNYPVLRDYINARNELTSLKNSNQKSK